MIDKIILGHNQFFGVNHLMAQTGNEKHAYFNDISRIKHVIDFSYDHGATGLMMSTHERAAFIADEIAKDPKLKDDLGIYLLVPYAAKYVRQANEKGLVNIVKDSISGTTLSNKISMFWRGGFGLLSKDIKSLLIALVDFEVAQFTKLNLRSIFLHDVVTDLVLGWNVPEVFKIYSDHIEKKYNAIPAFCTKNLPRLIKALNQVGLENPLIMASINKLGYQVNPSLKDFEDCLKENKLQLLAMSTLAAGFLKPEEAYEYLFSLPQVESVVVGVSSTKHVVETFSEIQSQMDHNPKVVEVSESMV